MKCLVIAYINAGELQRDLESIMDYYQFKMIECNQCFRVFSGHFKGNADRFSKVLNGELENVVFDVEDSIFAVYPVLSADGRPSMTNLVIKRKGNKYLRNTFH